MMSEFDLIKIDQQKDYKGLLCQLQVSNYKLTQQIDEILNEKSHLENEIKKNLQIQIKDITTMKSQSTNEDKKVRLKNRRFAYQIERKFTCAFENCGKSYGSETSLAYHMRVKHRDYQPQGPNKEEKSDKQDKKQDKSKTSLYKNEEQSVTQTQEVPVISLDEKIDGFIENNDELMQQEWEKIQQNLDL